VISCSLAAVACALRIAAADTTPHRALPPDRWLGPDKVQHFFVSGLAYAGSFAGARVAGADRRPALLIAIAPAAAIAVGKEIRDRRVTGRFSVRDLVADALGAGAYAALLARTAR